MILFLLLIVGASQIRPSPFWQNEIPLKNSVESRGCAYPKITGAKLRGGFYLVMPGLVPAMSIIGSLCLPDRHRRGKPVDAISNHLLLAQRRDCRQVQPEFVPQYLVRMLAQGRRRAAHPSGRAGELV